MLAAGASFSAALPVSMAHAQAYPTKPIRLIVAFPPGGPSDTLARLLGQKLSEKWGQQVIIDNRPGGNTIIGAELAAKSAPDGHTLLQTIDFTLTMNQALYATLPYDPVKSFAPVSLLTMQSLQLSVNPKFPAKSLKELVEYAKANPGKINYGTGAITSQIAGELFKSVAGVEMTNIPFKGAALVSSAALVG